MINKTIIQWTDVNDKLPPIDEDNIGDEGRIYSQEVLVTDGNFIEYAQYIYNWAELSDLKKDRLQWESTDLYNLFFDVCYWCTLDNIMLPKPPNRTKLDESDSDKKYSLRQLRQAWAAGKYGV